MSRRGNLEGAPRQRLPVHIGQVGTVDPRHRARADDAGGAGVVAFLECAEGVDE